MKIYNLIGLFLLLCFYGVSFAEPVDITNDLSRVPLKSAVNPSAVTNDKADTMTDIYDIKPLEKIGFDKRIIKYSIIILVSLILVGLLIYLIDYFIRRRKKEKIEEIIVIPADMEANRLLTELEKKDGLPPRQFYFELTAILRGYLGRRFEIDAPEMTTEELSPRINDIKFDRNLKFDLKSLLTSTDPVKFAGAEASIFNT